MMVDTLNIFNMLLFLKVVKANVKSHNITFYSISLRNIYSEHRKSTTSMLSQRQSFRKVNISFYHCVLSRRISNQFYTLALHRDTFTILVSFEYFIHTLYTFENYYFQAIFRLVYTHVNKYRKFDKLLNFNCDTVC